MRFFRNMAILLVPVFLFLISGCGNGNDSGQITVSPASTGSGGSGGTSTTPVGSTSAPVFQLKLTTDVPSIDVNNGTVLAKATLISLVEGVVVDTTTGQATSPAAGAQVPNWPVKFTILGGPATLTPPPLPTRTDPNTLITDSNGLAVMPITSGNSLTTTNVLVQASTVVAGQTITAVTSFQIVRGGGVIMFTTAAGSTPGGQTDMLPEISKSVNPAVTPAVAFLQPISFKVTDSNGNPRVGVPVTLTVYSTTGSPSDITIDFLVPPLSEPNQQTVTTDSAGMGIFNVAVTLTSPPVGSFTAETVIYKAMTNDAIPVSAYVGGTYSLTSPTVPPLALSPATASFGTATVLTFSVSGGTPPYSVTTSNTALVTATISGTTVTATLVDPAGLAAAGSVIITVTDSTGNSASATVSR
jgi:hypothetical protein